MEDRRVGQAKLNLLLIDHDAGFGAFLRETIEARGHILDWVSDGGAGIDQASRVRYDAVILDLSLPDMSGIDLCARLRATSWTLPILILSARNEVADRLQSFAAGADDIMAKPFDFDELMARLKAIQRPVPPTAKTSGGSAEATLGAGAAQLGKRTAHRGERRRKLAECLRAIGGVGFRPVTP